MKTYLLICLPALLTVSTLSAQIPRPEHPKPQFERVDWLNLNGTWNFTVDYGQSGEERNWFKDPSALDQEILVPFCPESELSGIGNRDFMPAVWYHRTFSVPAEWETQRTWLHFGAVDYDCRVWINGTLAGRHYGGSSSFAFDITDYLQEGENDLVVCALDDIRSRVQPSGKQSPTYHNTGCCKYNRTTGIWQTVWLEARPDTYLESTLITPDFDNSQFTVQPTVRNGSRGQQFRATLLGEDGRRLQSKTARLGPATTLIFDLENPEVWSPDHPYLYGFTLELLGPEGKVIDRVKSYSGLRNFHIEGNKIFLNDQPVFLRFVLDQGFYPDGIWTAPSDEALKADIELSMAVGFNGARLHEKVFEERFHYWADKLGYLTWGEFPDWGVSRSYVSPEALLNYQREWREVVVRDRNHPSIIAWTPLNETHSPKQGLEQYRRAAHEIYDLTHTLDPTRPINTSSGFLHVITDFWTVHDYAQNGATLEERYNRLTAASEDIYTINWDWYGEVPGYDVKYGGQPFVMDEYGGTFWLPEYAAEAPRGNGRNGWGYGKNAKQVEDLIGEITRPLLNNPNIVGYTYTQLTDVDQEVNGVYTFDRKLKFDKKRLREIFGAPSAYEQK